MSRLPEIGRFILNRVDPYIFHDDRVAGLSLAAQGVFVNSLLIAWKCDALGITRTQLYELQNTYRDRDRYDIDDIVQELVDAELWAGDYEGPWAILDWFEDVTP